MKRIFIVIAGVLILISVVWMVINHDNHSIDNITPVQVSTLISNGTNVVLLDVRTQAEFKSETGHFKGTIFVPARELETRMNELQRYTTENILTYCKLGHCSLPTTELSNRNDFKLSNM